MFHVEHSMNDHVLVVLRIAILIYIDIIVYLLHNINTDNLYGENTQ
jgi:hypothetical protein